MPSGVTTKQEYTLIESQYLSGFIKQVEEHLNEGWSLAGGVSMNTLGDTDYYCQALTRVVEAF